MKTMTKRTEQEIMQHCKGEMTTPFVSVCTIAYNHESRKEIKSKFNEMIAFADMI